MQDFGNTILAFLLAYPWLIPFYLLGLWYLVIKPLTYTRRERQEEAQQAQEYTQHVREESEALEEAGPEVRKLLSRTYFAWRNNAAEFDWPPSLAQFREHAARYSNADEYIEDRRRESAGVVSTCADINSLMDTSFTEDEFIIRCEPFSWLLTSRALNLLVKKGEVTICNAIQIADIGLYRASPLRIETTDGVVFEYRYKEFKFASFKEEIEAVRDFRTQSLGGI